MMSGASLSAKAKRVAAREAARVVAEALPEARVVGVGTGSTVKLVVEELLADPEARRLLESRLLVASSYDTLLYLSSRGLRATLQIPGEGIDVYFDGADEVVLEDECCMVKGRGAAMVREKLLAFYSSYSIAVVDESKVSRSLGDKGKPVPVEVLPPAIEAFTAYMKALGVEVRVRTCDCKDGPAVTDNGGLVVDTWPWGRMGPREYARLLDGTPGVVGHGIFCGYFDLVVVGCSDGRAWRGECKRTCKARTT